MKTECNYPSLETINLPCFVSRAKLQQLLHSTIECTSAIYTVRPYILFLYPWVYVPIRFTTI